MIRGAYTSPSLTVQTAPELEDAGIYYIHARKKRWNFRQANKSTKLLTKCCCTIHVLQSLSFQRLEWWSMIHHDPLTIWNDLSNTTSIWIRRPLCLGWGGGAREAWSIDCLACLPSHQRDRLRAMYPFPSLFSAGSKVGCLFDAYGHVHPSAMFPPAGVLLYCLWRFEQPRRIDEPSLQRHMLALLRTMYPTNVCLSFVPHPSTFVFSGFENG